jgi:hypothetical protein
MCLTDMCRAHFSPNTPAAQSRAVTPEPATKTTDGLVVAQSIEELRMLLAEGSSALDKAKARVDEIDARRNALMADFERELVWRSCDKPHRKCGLIAETMGIPEFIASFSANECKEPFGRSRKTLSRACSEKYSALFNDALSERYPLADRAAVDRECAGTPECQGLVPYELLFLKSHNSELVRRADALDAPMQAEREQRVQAYLELADATAEHNRKLVDAFEHAQEQRAQRSRELAQLRYEQEERDRVEAANRRAMAQALQAFATSMTTSTPATYTPASTPSIDVYQSTGCTSDFGCRYGWKCLKDVGRNEGRCAQAVNATGTPTFTPPSTSSVGPGKGGDCSFTTDCPIGFRCEKGSGLKGFCVK